MPDTICAIATPPGNGGIGIVRISGPDVQDIANHIIGVLPPPRKATLRSFRDASGQVIDEGIALYFPGPSSFTGEDVLELHGHGGHIVQELTLERVLQLGARLANPGEFTESAFLNDRIDLAQAEAVADLIQSASHEAARAAVRSLRGEFSKAVMNIDAAVLSLRVFVEGAIDFPEEEIDFISESDCTSRLDQIAREVSEVLERTRVGAILNSELSIVIGGEPNVGKSSLLNALLGEDRAIVTSVSGTTRDTLDARINIDGLQLRVVDTAGLHKTSDPVERLGVRRAEDEIVRADGVLWVVDDRESERPPTISSNAFFVLVRNKCDLSRNCPGRLSDESVRVSALHKKGLQDLRDLLKERCGFYQSSDAYAGRPRHIACLRKALDYLQKTRGELAQGNGELAAEQLRTVHQCLGDIVGATTPDALLGEIFSRFCIGK